MKNISIIGTAGLPACYGGFETLAENLVKFRAYHVQYSVYCSSKSYKEKRETYKDARLHYVPLSANGISSIIYDLLSFLHAIVIKKSDTLLVLGVSGCIILPILRLFYKRKIVTNIDGLEWKRDKWNGLAKSFLKYSEKLAVKYSDVVIADNKAIADYVKREYGVDSVVIAYGGNHAVADFANRLASEPDEGYAFSLCRIEPENNVHITLEAFAQSGKPLKFVGNWNISDYGRSLKVQYSDYPNIELIDPIYHVEQLFTLRARCNYYVHGHSAGGTNPSLVEIMHFAKPVIAFDCDYNRATTEDKAMYFHNAHELVAATDQLSAMAGNSGAVMLEIAQRRYTWEIVANQYLDVLCDR